MNRDFASSLIQLNNTFYREHSASFSDTRQAPWPGWVRTMDIALGQLDVATIEHPVRVFDLACGTHAIRELCRRRRTCRQGRRWRKPLGRRQLPLRVLWRRLMPGPGHRCTRPRPAHSQPALPGTRRARCPHETQSRRDAPTCFSTPRSPTSRSALALCTTCRRASTAYACSTPWCARRARAASSPSAFGSL